MIQHKLYPRHDLRWLCPMDVRSILGQSLTHPELHCLILQQCSRGSDGKFKTCFQMSVYGALQVCFTSTEYKPGLNGRRVSSELAYLVPFRDPRVVDR